MANLETISLIVAIVVLSLSLILAIWKILRVRKSGSAEAANRPVTVLTIAGLCLITLGIISRTIITGHGPFSNMYEFSIAFSWGTVAMGLFFQWRYRTSIMSTIGNVIALCLLIFAQTLPSRVLPLVPALQQSFLLTSHVTAAVIAYGTFTIGFGASILFLLQQHNKFSWSPNPENLDDISYTTVKIGFPFLTLLIVLGALWADIAWGKYWSWDPKETASLVTWLIYAGYLHARVIRGWNGKKAAVLLITGFAAVLFTFFGNYIFVGLHSYG